MNHHRAAQSRHQTGDRPWRSGIGVVRRTLTALLALAFAMAGLTTALGGTASAADSATTNTKVWVCKYSATPELGEKAQTVISVDYAPGREPGTYGFADAQGASYVYGWSVGPDAVAKPSAADSCPPYNPPSTDACPSAEMPGDQPAGTPCSKDATTEPVNGSLPGCNVPGYGAGVLSWTDVYTTTWSWDGDSWEPDGEASPVRSDGAFTPYTGEALRACASRPANDVETDELVGEQDCTGNTVTITHQERTRGYTWNGSRYVADNWGEWVTVRSTSLPAQVAGCPTPVAVVVESAPSVSGCEVTRFGTAYGPGTLSWVETSVSGWEPSADGMEWVEAAEEPVVSDLVFDRWSVAERVTAGCIEILGAPAVATAGTPAAGIAGSVEVAGVSATRAPAARAASRSAASVDVPTAVDAGTAPAANASVSDRGQAASPQLAGPALLSALAVALLMLWRRRTAGRPVAME